MKQDLERIIGTAPLTEDTPMELDSLSITELIFTIEDATHALLSFSDIKKCDSLSDLRRLLNDRGINLSNYL